MGLNKEISLGDKGKLVLSENAGDVKLVVEVAADVGGGDLKGFAKAKLSAEIDLNGDQLIDAGFAVIEAKFAGNPAVEGGVKALHALIDAALTKA